MNQDTNEKQLKIRKIAGDALGAAKDKIVANMRYMDPAVFALKEIECSRGFYTDGTHLYYEPMGVIRRARISLENLTHDYLHVLMHCIFKHYYLKGAIREYDWNLAADIAVEAVIQSLDRSNFQSPEAAARADAIARLRKDVGRLTAERIYRYLGENEMRGSERLRLRELFCVDDHDSWYARPSLPPLFEPENAEGEPESGDGDRGEGEGSEQEQETESLEFGEGAEGQGAEIESEQDWDQISQMVKTAIETSADGTGLGGGELLDALRLQTRKKIDYSTFLRKFASRKETMKVDDNAFDYIFYTYGLELYGDMPLIEPLEYSDEKSIKDFVIVIDTSASTEGELVRSFVDKTFGILQESPEIQKRFNIHVIQSDAMVQEDVLLQSRADVDRYLDTLEIKGMGGTDFRPAFQYVNGLLEQGAFTDLKGLVYFTDGQGVFPKTKPSYDTAFVFDDEVTADLAKVPPWAMKVVFGEE